jgi:hypothetical protein
MKDGKEETTEELLEYESDVDSDFLDELNELRIKNRLPVIQHGSEKVSKKSKKDGDIHSKEKIKIDWIKVVDEIKEEKD